MAKLSPLDFIAKWHRRFAPNTTFQIEEADFQEFATDIADSFGVTVANVPAYAPGATYAVGNLVRYTPAGGQEAFYYALNPGKLTAPGPTNTTDWKVVPGPTTATALSQAITLVQAQGLDNNGVVAGRAYLIDFGPDAQGNAQTITVRGVSNDRFDVAGTLEVNGVCSAVTHVDVQAGTWQLHVAGYTIAQADALLGAKADLVGGKVPAAQLPSYVDDVLEFASLAAFPAPGETGKIYIATDTNLQYRWTGTAYSKLSDSGLTSNQLAAITNATAPSGNNSFFTKYDGQFKANLNTGNDFSGPQSFDSPISFTTPYRKLALDAYGLIMQAPGGKTVSYSAGNNGEVVIESTAGNGGLSKIQLSPVTKVLDLTSGITDVKIPLVPVGPNSAASRQYVDDKVAAATPAAASSYSDAQARAAQLGRVPAQPTTTVTLTAEAPADYGTAASGTFTVDATGCVVGKEARFALGVGATAPAFASAPAGQPFKYLGVPYSAGHAFSYSLLVCLDRIEIVALPD